MRIGFSFHDLALGGAQCYFAGLMEGLASRGHELCYTNYAPASNLIVSDPSLTRRMRAIAVEGMPQDLLQCDVIQLDGFHTPHEKEPYAHVLADSVETYHSVRSVQVSGPTYAGYRVCVSRAVRDLVPDPARVIHYGVDTEQFGVAAADQTQARYDLAILGRVHPIKNHALFFDACEELSGLCGSVRALVIGGPQGQAEFGRIFRRRIADLASRSVHVDVTGLIPPTRVPHFLRMSRVLLVTSRSEGFGQMAVEAMACGVPVVANPVGGLVDIVRDGETGLLAREGDAESFAMLAHSLLLDESLAEAIRQRAYSFVCSRFSLKRMVEDYERIYAEAASGRREARAADPPSQGDPGLPATTAPHIRSSFTDAGATPTGRPGASSPRVSAIVSVDGAGEQLENAIRSVLDQTLTDFELIVVSSCSSDTMRARLCSFDDSRIVLAASEERDGLSAMLNQGLELATGDYVARVHPGETTARDRFEEQVRYLDGHPDVGFVGGAVMWTDAEGKSEIGLQTARGTGPAEALLDPCFPWEHCAPMFRGACIDTVGRYRDWLEYSQDHDLLLRISDRYGAILLDKPYTRARTRPNAVPLDARDCETAHSLLVVGLAKQRRATGWEDTDAVLESMSQRNPEVPGLLPVAFGRASLRAACFHYLVGDSQLAREALEASARHDPVLWQDRERLVQAIVDYGRSYAGLYSCTQTPADFVERVFSDLPSGAQDLAHSKGRALGLLHATLAFAGHESDDWPRVRREAVLAVRYDRSWLRNRGVWSILARALLKDWALWKGAR